VDFSHLHWIWIFGHVFRIRGAKVAVNDALRNTKVAESRPTRH